MVKPRIGVLSSHEGATLQAIIDTCASGTLPAQIATGDTPEALAERVQQHERGLLVDVLGRIAAGSLRLPN